MRRAIACTMALALAGCNSDINPSSPHDIIWKNLSNTGLRVVDVSMLYETDNGEVVAPSALCQTAPQGAVFRAFQGSTTIKGIACLEQDNSVSILFEKPLP